MYEVETEDGGFVELDGLPHDYGYPCSCPECAGEDDLTTLYPDLYE